MQRSFKMGTLMSIPIRVDFSWFAALALFTWSLAGSYFPKDLPGQPPISYWALGFTASLILFLSVVLHELGHSWVATRNGLSIRRITLFIFGGVAQISDEPKSAIAEFKIAIAGPIVSLSLGALFLGMNFAARTAGGIRWFVALTGYLAWANFFLGAANMIPAFPLDGGRVLRALIWHITQNMRRATRYAATAGKFFAFLIIAFGFVMMFRGNFLGGLWYIFIGWFLQQGAEASYQQLLVRDAFSGVKVRDIMTSNILSLSADISLADAVDKYFLTHTYNCYPVMDGDRFIGVLPLKRVKRVPKEEWPLRSVRDVATPLGDLQTVDPTDDINDALRSIVRANVGTVYVVRDGHLVGIVSRGDIFKAMQIRTALG
ncbi:MAG: site-2 protease family protein [bacterium]